MEPAIHFLIQLMSGLSKVPSSLSYRMAEVGLIGSGKLNATLVCKKMEKVTKLSAIISGRRMRKGAICGCSPLRVLRPMVPWVDLLPHPPRSKMKMRLSTGQMTVKRLTIMLPFMNLLEKTMCFHFKLSLLKVIVLSHASSVC